MIVDNGKYYLYRHIRLDKNEVFYVGIGTKPKKFYPSTEYGRAYNKVTRTTYWKNIVNKTDYLVEIMLESDSYDFILEKEMEFITLYGRINLKLGSLVNLTDGGKGQVNCLYSKKVREKHSKILSKKVYQYDLEGNFIREWENATIASNNLGIEKTHIGKCCRKIAYTSGGYKWSYSMSPTFITKLHHLSKNILQKDMDGSIVQEWESITKAAKFFKTSDNNIRSVLKSKSKTAVGYKWEFK